MRTVVEPASGIELASLELHELLVQVPGAITNSSFYPLVLIEPGLLPVGRRFKGEKTGLNQNLSLHDHTLGFLDEQN